MRTGRRPGLATASGWGRQRASRMFLMKAFDTLESVATGSTHQVLPSLVGDMEGADIGATEKQKRSV